MASYKLTYFNSQGVGETARYLLKYGKIDFEDVRIEKKDWSSVKQNFPFGQIPLLEHNGKQVGQSMAINRYLAKQVGLAGSTDWENLEIDAVVDTIHDIFIKLSNIQHNKDLNEKQSQLEIAIKETFPYYLSRLETIARNNEGFLATGRMTWADFYFATICPYFDYITGTEILANFPYLREIKNKVDNLPAIKEWIEVRPKNDYLKCK